eukprot:m.73407 g.73407  ORF g.73407 m.73407 type:complete len:587 (-) comp24555_c0_seq1:461-2221(-)
MKHSHLQSGSGVNLAMLRDSIRKQLLDRISNVEGLSKALVIEKGLISILGSVAEFSALKERGIERMFPLEDGPLPAQCPQQIIYLIRPRAHLIPWLAKQIRAQSQSNPGHYEHHIFFTPRMTMICERALKNEGVYGNCMLGEFHLHLVPLDSDLMSMELPTSFNDINLYGDNTSLFFAAHGVMQLQQLFGVIPRITGKGEAAKHVASMLLQMRKEQSEPLTVSPQMDSIILLDRASDLITPLCSQLTYEGLIDELFGINNNLIELPQNIAPLQPNGKPVKVELNSGDKLFSEIRDMNFSQVGVLLSTRARNLSKEYDERHSAKTVSQIKQFTSKLKRLQEEQASLRMHTDIAGDIMLTARDESFMGCLETEQNFLLGEGTDKSCEHIESCICRKDPLFKVLRLVCLQSIVNGGLKHKIFDFYRREILQTYGFEHLLTLTNLEKAGLFKLQDARSNYSSVKKNLKLIVEEEESDNDISNVYSGYAPLSIRLVQHFSKPGGYRAIEEILRLLPGPHFEYKQETVAKPKAEDANSRRPTTLVFFLGGCTFAEVSALRWLTRTTGHEYTIATTNMVNGRTMLEGLVHKLS